MKILRVNMSDLSTNLEDLPEEWKIIGGRALTTKILCREVSPAVDPLAKEAKLVIATGPVAGTRAPSCGRFSFGAKSPLTLGIKEANVGGPAGQKMDRLGIRAIIVEGEAEADKYHLLKIDRSGISLSSADQYKGLKNYDLAKELQATHSQDASIISIGLAGERKWKSAAITMTDKDGDCSRHAARGGLGAVMGAKGLKAIVLNDKGTPTVEVADRDAYRAAVKNWAKMTKEDPGLQGTARFGTTQHISALRYIGSMPALNYGAETLEGVENISGEAIEKINQPRGGKMAGCMPGCLVKCSVVFHDADGNYVTSSYEYETIALMGTNLGIVDPDVVARMDYIVDNLGLDSIELGSAMGVAASAGKMQMGDAASALSLLDEIEQGTEFGAVLGNGVVATCKALGIDRIPAYKGQSIPAHDPRVTKPTGVGYATSPMGADHTACVNYDDISNKEGQIERSLETQVMYAVGDALGYCMLATPGDKSLLLTFLKDLVNARYGSNVTEDDLVEIGKENLKEELKFNEGTEFHSAHDPDPAFVRSEPVGPANSVFDVDAAEIKTLWDKLDEFKFQPT
ncbi:MAG: aldehyde ferredoxin oxidoreductase [Proteobacteria bacterium]|nr:aldehyde ferredoxin oxidoreductase [Pseudomonadota bacterium]